MMIHQQELPLLHIGIPPKLFSQQMLLIPRYSRAQKMCLLKIPILYNRICRDRRPRRSANYILERTAFFCSALFSYFILFSRVEVYKVDSYTFVKPYSEVSTKDFGRSSQGTICPCFWAFSKNSRVRLDVEVLSISKMPMSEDSRTAISLPMGKYILISPLYTIGTAPLPVHHTDYSWDYPRVP